MINFTEHDKKIIKQTPWSLPQRELIADTIGSLVNKVNSLAPDPVVAISAAPNPVELSGVASSAANVTITANGETLGAGSGASSAYTISLAVSGDPDITVDSTASYSGGTATFYGRATTSAAVGDSAVAKVTVVPNSSYASANPDIASAIADLTVSPVFKVSSKAE